MLDAHDFERLTKTNTLEHHRLHPEVSVENHIAERRHAHAKEILGKVRIYLDQNWWIHCCEALRGKQKQPARVAIWQKLGSLVAAGRAVCPAGLQVLLETTKQEDKESSRATAAVIDQLAGKATIQPGPERYGTELFFALARLYAETLKKPPPRLSLRECVWTFPAFLGGERLPGKTGFSAEEEIALQKGWFDMASAWSYSDLIGMTPTQPLRDDEFVGELNKAKIEHAGDVKSFDDVRLIEAREFLKTFPAAYERAFESLRAVGLVPDELPAASPSREEVAFALGAVLFQGLKLGHLPWQEFPMADIQSAIHAEIRASNRTCHPNDTFDWQHASEALPYCDYFFTEKALYNLLREKRPRLSERYGCKVLYKDDEIVAALESLEKA
jgi:hypothetical protein